jgi:hypothetical protein
MKRIRFAVLFSIACMAALISGCVKSVSYLDRIATLEKQACACMDKACADKAFNEFLATARELKKEDVKLNDENNKKLGNHTAAIIRCVMMKGVVPSTMQEELLKLKNYHQ